MAKIAINLLPIEFTQAEVKKAKFYKIQALGVVVILLMVFLSSLTVSLRILQSHNIKGVQTEVSAREQKISGLKDRQASLLLLKNRLTTISQYLQVPSKQTTNFMLLDKLIPPSVSISSASVDKSGNIIILSLVPDSLSLNNMIDALLDKEQNNNLIKEISLDTISRGRDGTYRVSLSIKFNQ